MIGDNLIDGLQQEKDRLISEANVLDQAITLLRSQATGHNGTRSGATTERSAAVALRQPRLTTFPQKRTMSLSARRKIAAAQRARWAKVKKGG